MSTDSSHKQLSLNVHLNDDATFDNYFAIENSSNYLALQAVKTLVNDANSEPFVYVWGAEGVGVSHLLQAACHEASKKNLRCQYLPLEELAGFAAAQLLDGLEQLDLLCLDGVQHVMGQQGWDHALFHLYNRLRDNTQCRLLVSADCAPRDLGSGLPDLISRMGWGVAFHLEPLSDEDKMSALKLRAQARGIELSDDVLTFIIHRASRDMVELFDYLQRLDALSLAEKRRVTIPFIKEALGW
ncbi:MAG TPA: DnaA regulatory inactivator Hda [Pseudomonadales bacterium]|nr:DnaA regulatory inactivator Hda [Pseudomonadales bacterium]